MSLQRDLFVNVVVAASATVYSQPIDLEGNSNAFVFVSTIVGTSGLDVNTKVEGSSDLANWSTLSGTFGTGAAPTTAAVTYTGVGARYVRLKLINGASAAVYNASLSATMG